MNKINLESKHYCRDFRKIREILKKFGARKEGVIAQKDYFFDLPSTKRPLTPRLKLRIEGGNQTLIYYERSNFVSKKHNISTIKLFEVKGGELLDLLTLALGIKVVVDKKRELWRKKNTVFHLDTVKRIGNIFEIELQRYEQEITKEDQDLFRYYQSKLTPHLGQVIKGSNLDLALKIARKPTTKGK